MNTEEAIRQRDLLFRLVTTALLLYSLAHFFAMQSQLDRLEAATASLEAEKAVLADEHAALEKRSLEGESAEALEERARRELGLVRPGEIIFYFSEDGKED